MQKPSWPGPKPAGSLLAPCPLARPLPRGGGHLDPAAQSVWRKGRGARADPGPVADCQGRLEEVTTSLGLLPVWELCGGKEPSTVGFLRGGGCMTGKLARNPGTQVGKGQLPLWDQGAGRKGLGLQAAGSREAWSLLNRRAQAPRPHG